MLQYGCMHCGTLTEVPLHQLGVKGGMITCPKCWNWVYAKPDTQTAKPDAETLAILDTFRPHLTRAIAALESCKHAENPTFAAVVSVLNDLDDDILDFQGKLQ